MAFLPKKGETCCGFTAVQSGTISMLGARTVELFHEVSGARLLYIENDDTELGFNLIYRTPQFDESDSAHILEHLLLCSCQKYPSRDIFFDMDSKSYTTFMNGITDNTYTCYPICTQSENQLLRLMDVFLSCMEEPEALKDKNFFLREAIRMELDSPKADISLQGTVLNEDLGHLTDIQENADSHMAQTLYEGETAANLLGRAHLHYKEITYEKVKSVFERCYDYSNCLMVLYGKMDLKQMLEFLHQEHLSLHPSKHLDLRSYFNRKTAPGYHEVMTESPAYAGSDADEGSIIDYAIDLSYCTQKELIWWDLIADMLDNETSVWHDCAKKAGLNRVMEVYVDSIMAKPALKFRLHNSEPAERYALKSSALQALKRMADEGINRELFDASLKENRMTDLLTAESPHLGFNLSEEIGRYWSQTGKTDYFPLYEEAFAEFSNDLGQSIIRQLATGVVNPAVPGTNSASLGTNPAAPGTNSPASALVVTSPVPGLAEKLEQEKENWLKEYKAALSPAQLQELVDETAAFRTWNETEKSNGDFLIHPEELPAPPSAPEFTKKSKDGILFYLSPAPSESIGSFQLFFDISRVPKAHWNYLTLYQMLLTELNTARFTSRQQKNLEESLLHDCTFDELYPGPEAGEAHHPMMSVFWYSLTSDFDKSLDFLLDIMGNADYRDSDTILRILNKYIPDYDQTKADNAPSLAYSLAERYIRLDSRFRYTLNSPALYPFLKEVRRKLKQEPDFKEELAEILSSIAGTILTRKKLVFMAAASEKELPGIEKCALKHLTALQQLRPLKEYTVSCNASPTDLSAEPAAVPSHDTASLLPTGHQKTAACIDSPSLEIRLLGDFRGDCGFKGRFLPFLLAASDKYLKPAVRYSGTAYDSGIDFYLPAGYFTLWSTADSSLTSTLNLFADTGKQLAALSISEENLNGYILSAYAQALPPSGILNTRMRCMRRDLAGISTDTINDMISDIKNSSLSCQAEAAKVIDKLLQKGPFSAVGNEALIDEAKERFDEIIQVRELT